MFSKISNLIIPLMAFIVVLHGIKNKVDVYDVFIDGAKESIDLIISMFPHLLGMILSINIFIKSGFLDKLLKIFEPFFEIIKIPIEIIPLAVMRSISGSSSLAILNNVFLLKGPDSFIGRLSSVVQGSTDTTLYVITLYFGCIGIKKIRYALWAGIIADLFALICSIIVCNFIFN